MNLRYSGLPPTSIAELKFLIVSGKIALPGKSAILAKALLDRPDSAEYDNHPAFGTDRLEAVDKGSDAGDHEAIDKRNARKLLFNRDI